MSENLISGLYKKIKAHNQKKQELSKVENEFTAIVNGLVDFVNNNPDLTTDDIKILALTNKEKYAYFVVIFNEFPNVVMEIKENGSKNIMAVFSEKYKNGMLFDSWAYKLNTMIKNESAKHKFKLNLSFTNEHMYEYFGVEFKKLMKGNKTLYSESHRSRSCTGCVRYTTSITLQEICQIVAFVKFCSETKLQESTIRNMVNSNIIYDFSVIKTILDNKKSIQEELNNGVYGLWTLYKDFEYYRYREKEKQNNIEV